MKGSGAIRRGARAIALFGGTFDPVHAGHVAVAEAARKRFRLDAVYFIPSSWPPHKSRRDLAPFVHRYAMVGLACAGHPAFAPSLAEAPLDSRPAHVYYSIDTVRRFRREHPRDHLYFILGADQFLEIPAWKEYETLLESCDFIIAHRPGFPLGKLRKVIPQRHLAPVPSPRPHTIALRKSSLHLMSAVASRVSSTDIRRRAERGKSIRGLVPRLVEEYILRQALYR